MLKVKVDFKSFIRRGLPNTENEFMICLITGLQGSGKSYYGIKKMEEMGERNGGIVVYTNILSYSSPINEVRYFNSISELYNNHEKDCVFLIDELSKVYVKDSKIDRAFYSWLQQSRKHRRQVYMITQEYIQVPQWLRGVANLVYTTRKYLFFCITSLGIPVLTVDKEWGIDELAMTIYKRNQYIANLYDTYELINSL